MLYTLIAGDKVSEGPLDPSAYAFNDGPGIGGDRLAVLNSDDTNLDWITLEDPEASFANTLGGTAVVAPLQPLVAEPGSEPQQKTHPTRIYTIEEGDTITSIAAKFDISENTVIWANGLSKKTPLKVGDHLTILATTGVLHNVTSGDTLLAVAQKYDVDAVEIKKYNGLADSHKLSIGQKLVVPDGAIAPVSAPRITSTTSNLASEPIPPPIAAEGSGMLRPVGGYVSQPFGRYGHAGTDIAGNRGQAIHAALSGTVAFSGWRGGYGKVVILDHGKGLQTLYAHASVNYVNTGQVVNKGDTISMVGSTGRSTGDHLHFEVIKNGARANPCSLISC